MSSSISSMNDDMASIYDVIDLNREDGGRLTSMSSNSSNNNKQPKYRISLHSIDDDELKLFHRDLVTPAASVCGDYSSMPVSSLRHMNYNRRQHQQFTRPTSRTESVMLFKKINNGDEDVTSFDLVSSELRDFIINDENDFILEEDEEEAEENDDILPGYPAQQQKRPIINKTIISNNASNEFRNSLLLHQQQQQQQKNNDVSKSSNHRRSNSNNKQPALTKVVSPSSTNQHQQRLLPVPAAAVKSRTSDIKTIAVPPLTRAIVPSSSPSSSNTKATIKFNKDDYLYKQIPKRMITNTSTINNNNNPLVVTQQQQSKQLKQFSASSSHSSAITRPKRQFLKQQKQQEEQQSCCNHNTSLVKRNLLLQQEKKKQQLKSVIPGVVVEKKDSSFRDHANKTTTTTTMSQSYRGVDNAIEPSSTPEQKLAAVVIDTPLTTRKQQPFGLVRATTAYNNSRIDRNRSDTTSSSSSEELLEVEEQAYSGLVTAGKGGYHGNSKKDFATEPFIATSHDDYYLHQKLQQPHQRMMERGGGYLQQHRYSIPSNSSSLYDNYHSSNKQLSSSRTKSNAKKTSAVTTNMSVTDSAKQVLTCIRERRKGNAAMRIVMKDSTTTSPKLEGRGATATTASSSSRLVSHQHQQPPFENTNTLIASDFRSRLQQRKINNDNDRLAESIQRRSIGGNTNSKYITSSKRYDDIVQGQQQYQENDHHDNAYIAGNRLLFTTTSRLPQRTIYR